MQEENHHFTMEKKTLLPSRQQTSERKNADYSAKNNGRKKWKENGNPIGRSLESSTSTSKPFQKWNKGNHDKRPRQKGYFGNRQREEVVESADSLDVFSTGSRKGNANNLLRFHFAPRQNDSQSHTRWSGGGNYSRPKKTVRYNKEQFLQASCQFVVKDGGEYSAHMMDPDALVRWDLIELVHTFSNETVTCPICLNVPFAGKITKCGHIYCWACMIRYLTLGEKDYRKCPICYDSVNLEDLKSVKWMEVPDYKIGDTIDMKLMRKSKGSVYVCPKFEWRERSGVPHNFKDGKNTKYSKLLVANEYQIQQEVIDVEQEALSIQYEAAEDIEKPFISMAQDLLKIRKELLLSIKDLQVPGSEQSGALQNKSNIDSNCPDKINSPEFDMQANESTNNTEQPPLTIEVKSDRQRMDSESSLPFGSPVNPYPLLTNQPVSQSSSLEEVHDNLELPCETQSQKKRMQPSLPKNVFFFYQAATGQHIYLHSVNARCLQQEYGSLENCPETISASIVAIKRMFMTEDMRKRLRYLNHVPLTCEFHVVELNLKPILSKETLNLFRGELENLKKQRQREKKEDKIRAKQAELDHRKYHGLYPDMNISLDNTMQFPLQLASTNTDQPFNDTDVDTLQQFPIELASETYETSSGTASPLGFDASDLGASSPTMQMSTSLLDAKSFAKIAGAGSNVGASTAQRWRSLPESHSLPVVSKTSTVASDGEEELAAPSYGESMAAAFSFLDLGLHANTVDNDEGTPSKVATGKKKKKKEKQLLFSTAMARKN